MPSRDIEEKPYVSLTVLDFTVDEKLTKHLSIVNGVVDIDL